jgi:hypothetical protein
MGVLDRFYNWQRSTENWAAPKWNVCSPNILSINKFLLDVWGGKILGCHLDRSIVGGQTPSSHAYGAASDWGWSVDTHKGPGRAVLLNEVIPFLIDNSAELGVQAIHDYQSSRIWRSWRSAAEGGPGWRTQAAGSQMGQSWAQWIHVEVHKEFWGDGRPVTERLGVGMWSPWGPNRVVDTREGRGVPARLRGGVEVTVARPGFMPVGAKGYDAHITVINPAAGGFITAWGAGVRPTVSQVNYATGSGVTNNGCTILVAADGSFKLYAHKDCDVTVDIVGFYR